MSLPVFVPFTRYSRIFI